MNNFEKQKEDKLNSWNKRYKKEITKNKYKIIDKKEHIKDILEYYKELAKDFKKPIKRVLNGKEIIVYPDGKIYKNIDLNDF